MNDSQRAPLVYKPVNKVRIVTAASLFDGHDAAINIMRRILQAARRRGHPPRPQPRRSSEIVDCAIQEDAHGIAITSYQGGHLEFFKYMHDLLRERGGGTSRSSAAAAASSCRPRSRSCTPTASRASSRRTTAARWACRA